MAEGQSHSDLIRATGSDPERKTAIPNIRFISGSTVVLPFVLDQPVLDEPRREYGVQDDIDKNCVVFQIPRESLLKTAHRNSGVELEPSRRHLRH
jgi:hypothetical protein